jgi:plastocyanin
MRLWNTKQMATRQRLVYVQVATFLALLLAAMSVAASRPQATAPQEKAAANVVTIENFSFAPAELTVSPGTEVTWVNKDDEAHTVVTSGNTFKSKALDTGEKFSFTFHDPGTYEYFCSIHPNMKGKVIVK